VTGGDLFCNVRVYPGSSRTVRADTRTHMLALWSAPFKGARSSYRLFSTRPVQAVSLCLVAPHSTGRAGQDP
jgi:hypothetical protein